MIEVNIEREDIYKHIYFITAMAQRQEHGSMSGALSSKGDLIGGIFDRWINTVPENILFNKIILPEISNQKVEVISDYYMYKPQYAGIAPDVIGLKHNDKIVPFARFDEKWNPCPNMPQIEVKTFKKKQYLVSLRDQNYSGKFLVMAESNFRIDYLLPFFDKAIFSNEVYDNLKMMDNVFIVSNVENRIDRINKIDLSNNTLGSVKLLKITDTDSFEEYSTFCDHNESIQYIKDIERSERTPNKMNMDESFKNYCVLQANGLYDFNLILKMCEKLKCKSTKLSIKNIDTIKIVKANKDSIYIEITDDKAELNNKELKKGFYKISFGFIDRSSNNGTEYFMQKDLISYIPDKNIVLKTKLKEIIEKYLI